MRSRAQQYTDSTPLRTKTRAVFTALKFINFYVKLNVRKIMRREEKRGKGESRKSEKDNIQV